jgi:hypothetical protein
VGGDREAKMFTAGRRYAEVTIGCLRIGYIGEEIVGGGTLRLYPVSVMCVPKVAPLALSAFVMLLKCDGNVVVTSAE